MPKVTYILPSGEERVVEAEPGQSVMEAAKRNSVHGIVGECNGGLACATCHVYVDEAWLERTGGPDGFEESMLDMAYQPKSNSRLSCQIKMTTSLDGLVVRVPAKQI